MNTLKENIWEGKTVWYNPIEEEIFWLLSKKQINQAESDESLQVNMITWIARHIDEKWKDYVYITDSWFKIPNWAINIWESIVSFYEDEKEINITTQRKLSIKWLNSSQRRLFKLILKESNIVWYDMLVFLSALLPEKAQNIEYWDILHSYSIDNDLLKVKRLRKQTFQK